MLAERLNEKKVVIVTRLFVPLVLASEWRLFLLLYHMTYDICLFSADRIYILGKREFAKLVKNHC
jgi:hypothetical protein